MLIPTRRSWLKSLAFSVLRPRRRRIGVDRGSRPGWTSWGRQVSPQSELLEDRALLATLTVTSLADNTDADGEATLREAIIASRTGGILDGSDERGEGTDTIVFDPELFAFGDATVSLTQADTSLGSSHGPAGLVITSNLTIQGPEGRHGITIARNSSAPDFRLFTVTGSGSLTLENLTLTGGKAVGFDGGSSTGGGGGGGGSAGVGGAVYVHSGSSLVVRDSLFTENSAIGGEGGLANEAGASGGAGGGGFATAGSDTDDIGPGTGGLGGSIPDFDEFGNGGGGGVGGISQISFAQGSPGVNLSTIDTGGGGGGGGGGAFASAIGTANIFAAAGVGGFSWFGGGGGGGGAFAQTTAPGQAIATGGVGGSSIFGGAGNGGRASSTTGQANPGSPGTSTFGSPAGSIGFTGGGGGGAGLGGAIFNFEGTVSIINSTFSGNEARGGRGLHGGGGGAGAGGAIFSVRNASDEEALDIDFSTFARNQVTGGTNGFSLGQGIGGAVFVLGVDGTGNDARLIRSIFADSFGSNPATDIHGLDADITLRSSIVETLEDDSGITFHKDVVDGFEITSPPIQEDPMLTVLFDAGGPTQAHVPRDGSPADRNGTAFASEFASGLIPVADQRGAPFRRGNNIGAIQPVQFTNSFVVDTSSDIVSVTDEKLSLREALIFAAADFSTPQEVITFDPLLVQNSGGITVGSELPIDTSVKIQGPGADQFLIEAREPSPFPLGPKGSRVFQIAGDGPIDVDISGVTIAKGTASVGAGIDLGSEVDLELTDVAILFNELNGSMTAGAGIANNVSASTTITIRDSTIAQNNAGSGLGGGLWSVGDVTIINSTVSGNSAERTGGVIVQGDLVVRNSTITDNTSTGSAGAGGLEQIQSHTLTLENSIVASNSGSANPDLKFSSSDVSHSLIGSSKGTDLTAAPVGSPDGSGNLIGTEASPINPLLSSRMGPTFGQQFHVPQAGSPAINAGGPLDASDPTVDQRGESRVVGPAVDLGAIEVQLVFADYGDAPDTGAGTGAGNFNTLESDNGPRHKIVSGLQLGASIDGDDGTLQNGAADADDTAGNDDEDGVANAADLQAMTGSIPSITVTATNTTGSAATLYGWIDYNQDGVFDNATERADVAVPDGSNGASFVLTFPAAPATSAGDTFARFRLSTDAAAADATGEASDGEVEDYAFTIAQRQNIVVDTLVDEMDGDHSPGDLSLREAIALANVDTAADVIEFAPALTATGPATIALGGTELQATASVSIIGPGADLLTIDGGLQDARIFRFTESVGEAAISGLTITGGGGSSFNAAGAGVLSVTTGTVSIDSSVLSGSQSTGSGGAVRSDRGTVVLTNSTVSGNTSRSGGGLQIDGHLVVSNSTISGNVASDGDGGGILINDGTLTIDSSTITDNEVSATGGRFGGGIATTGNTDALTITNSIVAANTSNAGAGSGIDLFNDFGPTASVSHSLIGNGTASTIPAAPVGSPDVNGNLVGTNSTPIDPGLAPLQNNGGTTPTHALLPGSPARDGGDAGAMNLPSTDQRGAPFARNDGSGVDMGAYEAQTFALVVDTLDDESDGDFSAGDVSLREAIEVTNANPGHDAISFAPELTSAGPATIALSGELLRITDQVTVDGPGASLLSIDAQGAFQVLEVTGTGDANIRGVTITGGNSQTGGGIFNAGRLLLDEVAVTGNQAADGAGVYHTELAVSLTILNSEITDNSATLSGGGVFLWGPDSAIVNTTIAGNTANANGGGVWGLSTSPSLTNTTIVNNRADLDDNASGIGGGYGTFAAPATLINTIIAGNYRGSGLVADDLTSGGGAIVEVNDSFNNLIGDAASAGGLTDGSNGNIVGVDWKTVVDNDGTNPILSIHGGATRTIALLENGPAVNAGDSMLAVTPGMDRIPGNGDDMPLNRDQRSPLFTRNDGGGTDIGAFETQSLSLLVDTLADEDDGDLSAGDLSLREALRIANANPGSDTIGFDPALTAGGSASIDIILGTFTITDDVAINGPGAGLLTIDAQGNSRVIEVAEGDHDVALSRLTLTGGRTNGNFFHGAGVYSVSSGDLTVEDSRIAGNATDGDNSWGSGLYGRSDVLIVRTEISGNSTTGFRSHGGGIAVEDGSLTIIASTISGNSTAGNEGRGGGIFVEDGPLELVNSTVSSNATAGMFADGGGIDINRSTLTLLNSTVTANTTAGEFADGGGIFLDASGGTITNSIIAGNSAFATAPDLRSTSGNLPTVMNSLIGDNAESGLSPAPLGSPDGNGNLVGTNATPVDPLLGSLADNGGPTLTHALLAGSPAIDAGTDAISVVLDDFSTDSFASNYNFVSTFESPVNNPAVVGGQAQLQTGPGTGAFIWNQGEALRQVGDSVSIDFGFNTPLEGGGTSTASAAGLSLFSSDSGDVVTELRVNIDESGGILLYAFGSTGTEDLSGSPSGLMNLTVTVDAVTGNSISVTHTLSGSGFNTISESETFDVTELFFGPAAFGVVNDDAVHDNLTFTSTSNLPESDQRGEPRPAGNGYDIGSYEFTVATDFGDAPSPYPTLEADNGAVHDIDGPRLGAAVDAEADGQPEAMAQGDDSTGTDDEDGVRVTSGTFSFGSTLYAGASHGIEFDLQNPDPVANYVDAWIDFNADGDWDDTGEHVIDSVDLGTAAGKHIITIQVPSDANFSPGSSGRETFARYRISTSTDLSATGAASDGEVEDHRILLQNPQLFGREFGDAPAPYPTLLADNGAHHIAQGSYLGVLQDDENEGKPNATATGDDTDFEGDDEDGVVFVNGLLAGQTAQFDVTVTRVSAPNPEAGYLNAWLDLNGDGDWSDAGEHIIVDEPLGDGTSQLFAAIPETATPGDTFARFRLASFPGLSFDGIASDGEVEDYAVVIEASEEFDYGDAPATYPVLSADGGAVHAVGGPRLGALVDGESDGQPEAAALGDDNTGSDDEDGVRFTSGTSLFAGALTGIEIDLQNPDGTANYLDAFIDFNADGDWDDAGEHVLDSFDLGTAAGKQIITIAIPDDANVGGSGIDNTTFARFRVSTSTQLGPGGAADDGEVEDYRVTLNNSGQFGREFGDAPAPFPTLAADDGARHVAQGPFLGAARDDDGEAQPNATATGDDSDGGGDDEDGIVFVNGLTAGQTALIDVTVDQADAPNTLVGYLSGWLDLNGDGDWEDAGEQIITDAALEDGTTQLSVAIPGTATAGDTFARFRFSTFTGLSFDGLASDGEVEDYAVTIGGGASILQTLLPNTPNQRVEIFASGSTEITGVNLRLQLGDGTGSLVEPVFNGVDFTGSIFETFVTTVSGGPVNGAEQFLQASIVFNNSGDTVVADGLIATLLVDTTGITTGDFDLLLTGTEIGTDTKFILPGGVEQDTGIDNGVLRVVPTQVLGRHVFYNRSFFDNNSAAADAGDDGAIATDKEPLFAGELATFANYTSYSRGINGIMVDIAGLADADNLDASHFSFRTGNVDNVGTWTAAVAPSSVTVREGAGVDGSDRVTLIWPDGSFTGTWLEVTVGANVTTGLAVPDVFYFGNAPGESGNSATNTFVDGTDFARSRDNPRNFLNRAAIDFGPDYNRDSFVDGSDLAIARDNNTNFLTALRLLDLREPVGVMSQSVAPPEPVALLAVSDLAGGSTAGSDEAAADALMSLPVEPLPELVDTTAGGGSPESASDGTSSDGVPLESRDSAESSDTLDGVFGTDALQQLLMDLV